MADKKESKNKGEEFGVIGFTLGVLSIILVGSNGILIAIAGFIFSMIQQKKHPTKFSKAGIILNIIGFILAIIVLIVVMIWLKPLIENQIGNFPLA